MPNANAIRSPDSHKRSPVLVSSLLILGISQFFWGSNYFVGLYNDDACYLLKAFYFAGISIVPDAPPSTLSYESYSAGWPLILAPFTLLLGFEFTLYRFISLSLVYLGICCWLDIYRRYFSSTSIHLLGAAVLLSGSALQFSATLMSEPLFFFLVALSLWLWHLRKQTWTRIGLPIALALTCLTRTEGIALVLCFLAFLCWERSWRETLTTIAPALALFLGLKTLIDHGSAVRVSQSKNFFMDDLNFYAYVQNWSSNQLEAFSLAFLSQTNVITMTMSALVLVAGLVGGFRLLKQGLGPHPLLLLAIPAALFLWPYLSSRYWFTTLPLWLMGMAYATPKRAVQPILVLVIATQAWFAATAPHIQTLERLELYRSLTTTPIKSRVTGLYGCRTLLQTRRETVNLAKFRNLVELTAYMAREDVDFLIWENTHSLIRDQFGSAQDSFPHDTLPWLLRSSLFDIHFQNPAGVVARIRVPSESYLKAFESYRQALLAKTPELRLEHLRACLRLVGDFPPARLNLLLTEQELGSKDDQLLAEEFSVYLKQYPHDFESALFFSNRLPIAPMRDALEQSRLEATRTGREDMAAALSKSLESSG